MNIMIGCDPELFVKQAGKFVSGFGMVKGDKKNPHKVENGAVQVDGHALEFNIDPADNEKTFLSNIESVLTQLRAMVPDYELVADPVAQFTMDYLQSMPDEANELGCDPDFNAWEEGEANPRPDGNVDFRTGGGHVHIGWTKDMDVNDPGHIEACIMLTKELDYYLGVPSLFWDGNDKRREMYGAPGAFRVKSYGVEYRSLSNAWLRTPELQAFVYRMTRLAVKNLLDGKSMVNTYGDVARRAIASNSRAVAQDIIEVCLNRDGYDINLSLDDIPNREA